MYLNEAKEEQKPGLQSNFSPLSIEKCMRQVALQTAGANQ